MAIAEKDGKVVLVQNLLVSSPEDNIRDASLECAVIDKSGVVYRGVLKSNITDIENNVSSSEIDSKAAKKMITPVNNKNWVQWE